MYQQADRKRAIKKIQKYLFVLSDKKYKSIPRIPVNGIFDKETEDAVISFQRENHLPTTGIVNWETFTTLYNDYITVSNEAYLRDFIFDDESLPLSENDQNEYVIALNIMINELRKSYPQIPEVGTGTFFSKRTLHAIDAIRTLFLMPGNGVVDKSLYKRIIYEIQARKLFEEKYE